MDEKVIVEGKTRTEIVAQFQKEKLAAMKSRQVRVTYWSENDKLYSGQPSISLLTRANLHIPKMFEAVQTMASRIGGRPDIDYEAKPETDENAPELMEALFEEDMDTSGADEVSEASQIEAGLYGRGIYKLIPHSDRITLELVDTLAFLINPTAKSTKDMIYGGQQFIFKTTDQLEAEAEEFKYDKDVIESLKKKKTDNTAPAAGSMEKSLRDIRKAYLGYANVADAGTDGVENTEWYTVIKGNRYVLTVADDTHLLRCIKHSEAGLPEKRTPFTSWATFLRGIAFWTSSVADIVRDPNLAMDVTLNQMIDNNTYRNFGMVFVDSKSGLKQGSIVPRPLGVIPVTTGVGGLKDALLPWHPPEIGDAQQTLSVLNSIAENAVGLNGTPASHKGKQSVTQQAAAMALIEGKTNKMRRSFINAWKDMADLYAEMIQINLTKPRAVKVYGHSATTVTTVTKDNFKDVKLIAKATASELSQENKAIRQKASVEMYTLFKDDPMIPGQKFLRERVAKEFDLSPGDIGSLFASTPEDEKYMQQIAQAKAAEAGGGDPNAIPQNPEQPQLSANAQATASHVPPAIR